MSKKNEYKEYANKSGINSGEAYEHLFKNHEHPLGDDGEDVVTFNVALEAIKIAEDEIRVEFHSQLKKVKEETSWFMQIINKLFCLHDYGTFEIREISSGSGASKRVIREIILFKCNKCGRIKKETINATD